MLITSRSSVALLALVGAAAAASLPQCPDPGRADYDFVVVGAGAGGGPLASRLAESGYSVLLVDAGHDVVNYNTTLPGFNLRTLEDAQVSALVSALPQQGPPIDDLNALASDGSVGVNGPSATIDENHIRSSVHERLQSVNAASPSQLQFSLDTLATKVLLCSNGTGGATTAYGVQIVPGAALPVASNFHGKASLKGRSVTAKYEVIVSAGVFQSPQLLMLSGIGDKNHLSKFGIQSIINLPGVGSNLQDHDEVSVIWYLKQNYTLFNGCTFLSDPKKDPCLQDWIDSDHKNLYAFTTTIDAIITKSTPNRTDPDVMTYFTPAFFPGFFKGAPQQLADTHNALSAIVLKAHPSSRGTVRLTGSHPQDRLEIEKFHFQAPGGYDDIAALRNGVRRAREIVQNSAIGPLVETEVFPGANTTTDDQINDFIFNRVFGGTFQLSFLERPFVKHSSSGHHGCCTNAMGPDSDSNSVLDGNFKVRGVDRLRVVDASAWPHVPGFFITTPTYMVNQTLIHLSGRPLKIRVDIRDLWDSSKSEVQASITSLQETLGLRIEPVISWTTLWNELKDRYPDKTTFIPSIVRIVNTWYSRLLWRLDSDNFPAWTEELLDALSDSRKELVIELSSPPHNRPRTYWNPKIGSFFLSVPKTEPPLHSKVAAAFDQDFDNLLTQGSTSGPADEGWDVLAADTSRSAPHGDTPEPRRSVTTHSVSNASHAPDERPKVDRLPGLGELSRPNELFARTAPYILTLDLGNPLVVRCSHEATLDLLSAYLTRWGKVNTGDSMRRNVFKIELVESAFCSGLNDTLTIEPHINFRNNGFQINPTLILAFIEGVLGYKLVHTNGHNWVYRSDTILK
ncbi:hypothetical protein C0991_006103 [Blastosporella zonata]|nr:hypothetical protein C0991_006103 [Blastosporella zonata]